MCRLNSTKPAQEHKYNTKQYKYTKTKHETDKTKPILQKISNINVLGQNPYIVERHR
jgi:hypothetical protein